MKYPLIFIDPANDPTNGGWWLLDNLTYNYATLEFNRINVGITSYAINQRAEGTLFN